MIHSIQRRRWIGPASLVGPLVALVVGEGCRRIINEIIPHPRKGLVLIGMLFFTVGVFALLPFHHYSTSREFA